MFNVKGLNLNDRCGINFYHIYREKNFGVLHGIFIILSHLIYKEMANGNVAFTFNGDLTTGLNRPGTGRLALMCTNTDVLTASISNINLNTGLSMSNVLVMDKNMNFACTSANVSRSNATYPPMGAAFTSNYSVLSNLDYGNGAYSIFVSSFNQVAVPPRDGFRMYLSGQWHSGGVDFLK
jgi:hypothetical protein